MSTDPETTTLTPTDSKTNEQKKASAKKVSPEKKNTKKRDGSKRRARSAKGREVTPPPPPSPRPGDAEWTYSDLPLSEESAQCLLQFWERSQRDYGSNVKLALHAVRKIRADLYPHLYEVKTNFYRCIHKPDEKQDHVDEFQRVRSFINNRARSDCRENRVSGITYYYYCE